MSQLPFPDIKTPSPYTGEWNAYLYTRAQSNAYGFNQPIPWPNTPGLLPHRSGTFFATEENKGYAVQSIGPDKHGTINHVTIRYDSWGRAISRRIDSLVDKHSADPEKIDTIRRPRDPATNGLPFFEDCLRRNDPENYCLFLGVYYQHLEKAVDPFLGKFIGMALLRNEEDILFHKSKSVSLSRYIEQYKYAPPAIRLPPEDMCALLNASIDVYEDVRAEITHNADIRCLFKQNLGPKKTSFWSSKKSRNAESETLSQQWEILCAGFNP